MESSSVAVRPCSAPAGMEKPGGTLWWTAIVDGEPVARIGAYPWKLDNALCLHQDAMGLPPYLEVTSELVETVLRFADEAGYEGIYAITYASDPVLPEVLEALGFDRVETGRAWSDNPTTCWFLECS